VDCERPAVHQCGGPEPRRLRWGRLGLVTRPGAALRAGLGVGDWQCRVGRTVTMPPRPKPSLPKQSEPSKGKMSPLFCPLRAASPGPPSSRVSAAARAGPTPATRTRERWPVDVCHPVALELLLPEPSSPPHLRNNDPTSTEHLRVRASPPADSDVDVPGSNLNPATAGGHSIHIPDS
jgi:hypothetical protein